MLRGWESRGVGETERVVRDDWYRRRLLFLSHDVQLRRRRRQRNLILFERTQDSAAQLASDIPLLQRHGLDADLDRELGVEKRVDAIDLQRRQDEVAVGRILLDLLPCRPQDVDDAIHVLVVEDV